MTLHERGARAWNSPGGCDGNSGSWSRCERGLPPQPRFLPGGRRFLYLSLAGISEQLEHSIFVGDLDAAQPGIATEQEPLLEVSCRPRYAPPTDSNARGYLLYGREATLLARPFDATRAELWAFDDCPPAPPRGANVEPAALSEQKNAPGDCVASSFRLTRCIVAVPRRS